LSKPINQAKGKDHGHYKHGLRFHPLYSRHRQMLARCYNIKHKSYKNYGGRGITVCDRWHDVVNFIADMESAFKPELRLDRIDNNGNYEPSNCRWTTCSQNSKNRRCRAKNQSKVDRVVCWKGKWYVMRPFETKEAAEKFAFITENI